jgi:uncharacterized protein
LSHSGDHGTGDHGTGRHAADVDRVAELLGRPPAGDLSVVARGAGGEPSVIANPPFLRDGTPMPTRYWLVDPALRAAVSRLEAEGGVRAAAAAVDAAALAGAHARYAAERDALVPAGHAGPRPSGGVGGTRTGVKCLHAHLAWWLVGGDDPVGDWVAARLGVRRDASGVQR